MAGPLTMTQSEREEFLADLHVGVISIERADAAPLTAPIWYRYSPDVGVWILTAPHSLKGKALAAVGRFSLCAQVEEPPAYKYVSVSGPIIEEREADKDADTRPMAHRYFGKEMGDLYVDGQSGETSNLYIMRPDRWLTVDYGKILPAN